MEKLLVLEQLEQAERHLLEAHVRVDQQRKIVAWLAREHRDTTTRSRFAGTVRGTSESARAGCKAGFLGACPIG